MKLRKQQIEIIASRIIDELREKGALDVEDESKAKALVRKVITDDLMVEDKLNEEVRELLAKVSSELHQGSVEYHKMFRLVKEKLVKERNLIL
ncbi:MAG: DUF507 family protein [bacterium]|nr:DUF507 family protein [bacterium]